MDNLILIFFFLSICLLLWVRLFYDYFQDFQSNKVKSSQNENIVQFNTRSSQASILSESHFDNNNRSNPSYLIRQLISRDLDTVLIFSSKENENNCHVDYRLPSYDDFIKKEDIYA